MISSITIKDFKSYRHATLDLSPLTVLIGANASGKSNAVEALRLLSWIAQGHRLDSDPFTINGRQRIRGNVGLLGYQGATHFSFECQATHSKWDRYSITLSSVYGEFRIVGEEISGTQEPVSLFKVKFWEERPDRELHVGIKGAPSDSSQLEASCNDQMAVLIQIQNLPRVGESAHHAADLRSVTAQYEQWLSSMVFLDAHPAAMRQYSPKTERRLASDGSNLSGVLFNLCRNDANKAALLRLISILPEQEVRDIGFIETPRDEVMVQLTEVFGGSRAETDVTVLSDGTLRVLAGAAAVLSAPEGGLVVLEEIDAGVHPSRASALLDQISLLAGHRKVRVLTTSHDPALLDAVPDDRLPNIVFCYRDPEVGDSKLVRLGDLPQYPELVVQGPIGQLLTRGVIDGVVKDPTSPEERTERALAWLEDLRARTG